MVTIIVEHHHYIHGVDGLQEQQFIELKQLLINNQGILMNVANQIAANAAWEEQMADDVRQALDELTDQVAGLEDSEESLITYVQGLSAQLDANAGNAQAVRDISAKLRTDARRMADAVLTPGAGGGGATGGAGGGGTVTTEPGGGAGPTSPGGDTGATSPGGAPTERRR